MLTVTREELPTLQTEHAHLLQSEQTLLIQYNAHRCGGLPDPEPLRLALKEFSSHVVEHFSREEGSELFQPAAPGSAPPQARGGSPPAGGVLAR